MSRNISRPYASALALILALLMALSLISCGDDSTPPAGENAQAAIREGVLRLPLLSLPYTFNPDAMDENAEAISENLFSRLVRLTSTGELLPDLAAEWSFNDAATELTLTLRQGVTWHDEQPFTADDVVWTLSAIRSQSGVLYEQFSPSRTSGATSRAPYISPLSAPAPCLSTRWPRRGPPSCQSTSTTARTG